VKPEPVPTPGPPIRRKEPVNFYDERDRCLQVDIILKIKFVL